MPATCLASRRNLGGTGGFALGMLHALALGAEWGVVRGRRRQAGQPNETVLDTLLAEARSRGLAEVSPMITNIDTPSRLGVSAAARADLEAQRGRAGHGLTAGHRRCRCG